TVRWQVQNVGTGTGLSSIWTDTVLASPDAVAGNGDDIVLAQFVHTGALGVTQGYAQQQTIQLPPQVTGHFHLFVGTASVNQVFENGSKANNAAEAGNRVDVMPIPYADLFVSAVTPPASALSGATVNVTWTVVNQGIGTTSTGNWNDHLVLASDPQGQ